MASSPTDPSLAVLAANVVVGPQGEAFGKDGSPWMGLAVSRDGGDTWNPSLVPGHPEVGNSSLDPYCFLSDPSVAFAPDGASVYVAGMVGGQPPCSQAPGPLETVFVAAVDLEAGDPRTRVHVLEGPSVPIGPGRAVDRPWLVVDEEGIVHLAFSRIEYEGRGPGNILHVPWFPSNASFGRLSQPAGGLDTGIPYGADLAEDEEGRLHVVWTGLERAQISHAVQAEPGAGWQLAPPVPIVPYCSAFAFVCPPDVPATVVTDPRLVPTGEGLLLAWTDNRTGTPQTLFATSDDAGRSWSQPDPVADEPGQGTRILPGVAVHNGTVWVSELAVSSDEETYEPAAHVRCPGSNGFEPVDLDVEAADLDPDGDGFTFFGHHYVDPTATPQRLLYPWVVFQKAAEGEQSRLDVEQVETPCGPSGPPTPSAAWRAAAPLR